MIRTTSFLVRLLLFSILASLLLAACTPSAPLPKPQTIKASEELNIYGWDTEIDPALLTEFAQKFNVKMNFSTYANLEEMLENVKAHPGNYDLIVPGDYMVTIMRKDSMLAPLNKANIPNFKNIDPAFISPAYDPGNRYCAPFLWGTLGIGYNIKVTGREIHGWRDFFDPVYSGRVSLLADSRYTMGAVLEYLGFSPNTTSNVEITQVRDFLISRSKHVVAYAPDTGQDLLAAGTVDLAYEWSGDIFQLMKLNPDIRYVIPEEGSILWIDSLCIPRSSPHKDLAEVFINFMLDAKIGAANASYALYASPNLAAIPFLSETDRNNPILYPTVQMRSRLFLLTDIGSGEDQLYEHAWTKVLAAHDQ